MAKVIALIPARKGSKRVPGKNTRLLNGKPLVEYSIRHAMAAKSVSEVVVSTDDDDVKKIASSFGCRIITRPAELADDAATTVSIIRHSLDVLRAEASVPDYVVLLQPTVPIRASGSIDEAVALLTSTGCDSVISHVRVDYFHPNRMKRIEDGRVRPYSEPEIEGVGRDKLPPAYYRDGSIYAMRAGLPLEKNTLFGDDVRAIVHDRKFMINIDDERDWQLAEILIREFEESLK